MPISSHTSKDLLTALRRKYPNVPILGEVTLEDKVEAKNQRTANAIANPNYKKWYDKKGLDYDLLLPDGWEPNGSNTTMRRIDALMWDGTQKTAIEIKISRADFFRDTEKKRAPWIRHTHRFVYLTPKNLIKPEELPTGCGLWEYENGHITVTKKAVINKKC